MMNNLSRYIFIFNPAADKGRALRKAEWLKAQVSGRTDSVLFTTTYAGHAEDIACSEKRAGTCMIACGGDGTLHEVVNAVAGEGVTIGIVPIGSANDFIKTLHPQNKKDSGITHFFEAKSKNIDIGSVFYGIKHRYFINSLGIGFTGRIAKSVKRTSWLKGELGYVYALFSVLFDHKPLTMGIKITLEDSFMEFHEPVFAFSVLNGKIEGGKFRIAPNAELSDGLLDVCILKAVPKHEFFRYAFKYLYGIHITDPQVIYCKAKAVEVMLENPDVMHLDGEVYDGICGRITISVVSKGISVL
jgi:diacylglycerol kinase (ATP)